MATYMQVLSRPGVLRVVSSQLFARFPFGLMSLAFVLHIQEKSGSYALAGLALGLETVGVAVSGPLLGRWMGGWGVRRTLLVSATISTSTIFVIGLAPLPPEVLAALCLVVGLSSPPIQSAVRTIYPMLVERKQMGTLYALDATLQEVIWIFGPVTATFIAAFTNTTVGIVVMGVIQITGAFWFSSNREIRRVEIPKSKRRLGGVLRNRIVISNAIIGALLIGSFSGVEIGTVAVFTDKATAGIIVGVLSVGSLLGGFLFGHRSKTRWALSRYLMVVFVGFGMVFIAPDSAIWVSIAWFIAGLGIAPALGLLGAIIGASVKTADAPEAYGWVGSGQMIGYAGAAAIAGLSIDLIAPEAALLVAVVMGGGAVLVALMSAKFTPVISSSDQEEEN
jgi:MFS family permease